MSPLLAVLLIAVPIAALALWWLCFRQGGDDGTLDSTPLDEPIKLLSVDDVQAIERALGVTLPSDYAAFLQKDRPGHVDSTTVRDDPELIIGFTQDYRSSNGWPTHFVWVGDEADGCPYTLDCETGEIFRLQKGNLGKAWDRHRSFSEFVSRNAQ